MITGLNVCVTCAAVGRAHHVHAALLLPGARRLPLRNGLQAVLDAHRSSDRAVLLLCVSSGVGACRHLNAGAPTPTPPLSDARIFVELKHYVSFQQLGWAPFVLVVIA